eukprot:4158481-Prymnesium_polylepis.1
MDTSTTSTTGKIFLSFRAENADNTYGVANEPHNNAMKAVDDSTSVMTLVDVSAQPHVQCKFCSVVVDAQPTDEAAGAVAGEAAGAAAG